MAEATYRTGIGDETSLKSASGSESKTGKPVDLNRIRKAIQLIECMELRRDYHNLVVGAEIAIQYQNERLAVFCLNSLVTTTIAINQTISTEVAVCVLDAVLDDVEEHAVALRGSLGFTKTKDAK